MSVTGASSVRVRRVQLNPLKFNGGFPYPSIFQENFKLDAFGLRVVNESYLRMKRKRDGWLAFANRGRYVNALQNGTRQF